ncbi:methyltransferase family protein [Brucella intermedia]|uniref:Isoprenylcysteine carboxylmethyltransferase family protein n=2 Tax=Hyphomicrobiales TaxID=356 RepID=A0A857CG07_9HYPH|nr:isoprenylcysteine carboxylmethyltransferase family protein [Brucella intermedia]EXL01503.1 isoprenylcysteine carboxyl methyltransferase [Brucella anthropi]QGZ37392.1 isoprenylcysteine carboxylmethyltransferase family protein [Stappia indica]WGG60872.1 isoprenylcysteine carboxylmethyltransferase family protein [Brucella intermedia]
MLKSMHAKSPVERKRTLVTWLLAPAWLTMLIATQPEGFETLSYSLVEFVGFFLVFAAVLGRLWCTLYIGGRKDLDLCQSGPYSLSRNPLYFFSFLGLIGVCLAAQNISLAVISAIVFFGYYRSVIKNEEKRLLSLFGADYILYMARVPRFFPRLHVPESEDILLVQSQTFIRSLKDVSWFLAGIIGIEVIEELRQAAVISGWQLPL